MMDHPNRVPFFGVLTLIGYRSNQAPGGARGHKVRLLAKAAREALPSLIGMGVNFEPTFSTHDYRHVAGIITEAEITKRRIEVRGYLFGVNFPDLIRKLDREPDKMGMSYELHNAHVEDMRAPVWRLKKLTFTGASILERERCAYRGTSFRLDRPESLAIAAKSEAAR